VRGWRIGIAAAAAATGFAVALLFTGSDVALRAPHDAARLPASPLRVLPGAPASDEGTPTDPSPDAPLPPPPHPPRRAANTDERRRLERPTTIPQLSGSRGWVEANDVAYRLPSVPAGGEALARLGTALDGATNPVSRQNIIFLVALTVPWERSEPWLRDVARAPDPEDAEDALGALAFSGAADEVATFRRLAREVAPAGVHRLMDELADQEALAREGTREARRILRSYRVIEVLDREPYFKLMAVVARVRWLPHPSDPVHLAGVLLPAWLDRYRGHPGSDDMAYRVGRAQTNAYDAALWFARSASLPDQDCRNVVRKLVGIAEFFLEDAEIDRLANDRGLDSPNRTLLRYIRARRTAARRGFAEGLVEAELAAREEPGTPLGHAWRLRWSVPAPRGIDSGLEPPPAEDRLRLFVPDRTTVPEHGERIDDWRFGRSIAEETRLEPPRETVRLDVDALARQFRAWEAMGELERRTATARGSARSDLLYRQAAIFYHNACVLLPVYAYRSGRLLRSGSEPTYVGAPSGAESWRLWDRYVTESSSDLRAIALFDRIANLDPRYPGADRVLFSRALTRRRLIRWGSFPPDHPAADYVRALVEDLERCAAWFPSSPLADDALRAAGYWRRRYPALWGR